MFPSAGQAEKFGSFLVFFLLEAALFLVCLFGVASFPFYDAGHVVADGITSRDCE